MVKRLHLGRAAEGGVLAAQRIKPQARVLAAERGITCVEVDYDSLRGLETAELRLF
jgi:endonuclease